MTDCDDLVNFCFARSSRELDAVVTLLLVRSVQSLLSLFFVDFVEFFERDGFVADTQPCEENHVEEHQPGKKRKLVGLSFEDAGTDDLEARYF